MPSAMGNRLSKLEAASPLPPQNYLLADLAIARWLGHNLAPEQAAEVEAWRAKGAPADERTRADAAAFGGAIADLVERTAKVRRRPASDAARAFLE